MDGTDASCHGRFTAGVGDARPDAVDPFALSRNEKPFPPLPAVRSALIHSIDAVNRYPEFLPERLRNVIAVHNGVSAEQVLLGAGAKGMALQALQALTSPGDAIAMSTPTFDSHPIIARSPEKSTAKPMLSPVR